MAGVVVALGRFGSERAIARRTAQSAVNAPVVGRAAVALLADDPRSAHARARSGVAALHAELVANAR